MCLWPGYNRKVAACLATAHMQEESWALSSCSPASLPLPRRPAPRGGLSHPLRLRPALPRHNPWWIWCLVFVFVSVLRFFNSSSLPPSCENNSPGSSSSHQPFSAHHQLRLSLLLPLRCIRPEILSLTRLATDHSATPWPVSCPALPSPFFRRDDASSRYRVSQSNICHPAVCSTSVLPTDWTGVMLTCHRVPDDR